MLTLPTTKTITLTGTPAFNQFAYASRVGVMQVWQSTFSGSATGSRYNVDTNSVIFTNVGVASFLPGNTAGTSSTGGQYV